MKINVNGDLNLGSQEINRLIQSLDEKGFRSLFLKNSISFGLFDNSTDGNWDNFSVTQGTNVGTLKVKEGIAVDNTGKIILWPETNNIALTDDNLWRWIKVSHQFDTRESGIVSIDVNGNLTGDGTNFLSSLRGLPNNPTRISFSGSVINIYEYDLVEVIDDTNAILAGNFVNETGLKIRVVGSFTPSIVVPSASKFPFQYDGCLMTLVAESVANTPPALTDGQEFLLARIKRNGGTVSIEDKRSLNVYRDKTSYQLNKELVSDNPLIGIESVRFNNNLTTREENLIYIGFGFRSSNWTTDSSTNRVTLISGLGGKFKTTSNFTDGDFDGWRLYTKDGQYATIKQSSLVATQINLILDTLDPDRFTDTTQELRVAPNVEQIELIFSTHPADGNVLTNKRILLPINSGELAIPVVVYKTPSCTYNIRYRYKNFNQWSEETAIPSDTVNGYLIESDFNVSGVQTDTVRATYTSHVTNGFITLTLASNAYSARIASVETGDLFGIEYLTLDNSEPVRAFIVGTRKQQVVITNDDDLDQSDTDFGTAFTFTGNQFLNIRSDVPSALQNGNNFLIHFRGDYIPSGFSLRIVEDYVNSGNIGTVLYTLTSTDYDLAREDRLVFKASYDGTRWFIQRFVSSGGTEVTSTRTLTAGAGLTGGGTLAADRTFDVNVDASTIEINADILRVKDSGITAAKLASDSVTAAKIATSVAGNGLAGGGGTALSVNVDTTLEISSDAVRLPNGYKAVQSPDAVQLYTKVVGIGTWDMVSDATKTVAHGLGADWALIVNVTVMILDDSNTLISDLTHRVNAGDSSSGDFDVDSTNVNLRRNSGSWYNAAPYDSNIAIRGYIYITYKD